MRTYLIALLTSVTAVSAAACGSSGETPDTSGAGGSPPAGATSGGGGSDDACTLLPENIEEDTTVGPGCVRLQRTRVRSGDLTIAPGTTVLVEAGGFLALGGLEPSNLIAKGTEDEPIVFTSAAASPAPGDWQCVRFGPGAAPSRLEHVTLEYGGQPCEASGAKEEATLVVTATVGAISQVTIKDSLSHGILVEAGGFMGRFDDNTFSGNGKASILVAAPQVFSLGAPNTFLDADDVIEVDGRSAVDADGVWRKQAVPFRSSGFQINSGNEVTIEAGTRIEMTGGSIDAFAATLNLAGTEEEPVVITSAQAEPQAGDWGCLVYSSASALTPRIEHAVLEYGGGGQGCSGANEPTLLWVPPAARITDSVFRHSEGTAIKCSGECDAAAWCANTFESIASGPLECGTGSDETACP